MRRWFRNRSEKRLDQELRYHFEEQVDEYVTEGLSPDEARRKARLEFGHLDEVKEVCRDGRPLAWLDGLRRDVRFALRMFARSPGFTAVCLITLALGIGANGAVFSVINELALKPPPFKSSDRVVVIDEYIETAEHFQALRDVDYFPIYPMRRDFQAFEDIAVLGNVGVELLEGGEPEGFLGGWSSGNLMQLLGTAPALGRWFSKEESESLAPVVVLSHRLWRRRFQQDPNILGRTLRIIRFDGDRNHQVIGVLPPALDDAFPLSKYQLFLPYDTSGLEEARNSASYTLARLAPNATIEQASDELISRQVTLYPGANYTNGGRFISVRSVNGEALRNVQSGLVLLVCSVGCVLLIACANLAGLLLTRNVERKREMAIRSGLGAGSRTILAQTLVETGMLTGAGAAGALFVSWAGLRGLQAIQFRSLPDISKAGINWQVIAWCAGLAVLTALLIGALPALAASRTNTFETLRQTTTGARFADRRSRDLLIVLQIALSVVLVVGAGLMVHSMGRIMSVTRGYDPTNVISLSIETESREDPLTLWHRFLKHAQATPGVKYAAMVNDAPGSNSRSSVPYRLPDELHLEGYQIPLVDAQDVNGDYFALLGMRFIAGRGFSRRYEVDGHEVVVSRSLAQRFWPGQDPLGQRFYLKYKAFEVEVVGVVDDPRQRSLTYEPRPILYRQAVRGWGALLVRTEGDPFKMLGSIKAAVREADPTQVFESVTTIFDQEDTQNAELRFYMYLLSAFAGLALLLAVIGLYSVAAQAAVRRTQEIGLRMAVGASRSQILIMIARQGLALATAGIALGIAASCALSKYLASWLYEITPTDPLTFGAAALLLALVAWIATFIPARRAARLDPMKALRYE